MNVAFTQRVAEQVDAKNKLQSHLNRVSIMCYPLYGFGFLHSNTYYGYILRY